MQTSYRNKGETRNNEKGQKRETKAEYVTGQGQSQSMNRVEMKFRPKDLSKVGIMYATCWVAPEWRQYHIYSRWGMSSENRLFSESDSCQNVSAQLRFKFRSLPFWTEETSSRRVAALRKVRRKTTLTWRTCVTKKKKRNRNKKKNRSFDARLVSATHPLRTYMYVHEGNELCWVGLRAYLFSLWPCFLG